MATKPIKFLELHYTMTQFSVTISDISQSQLGNIQSCDVFRPIVLEQKYLMDYNAQPRSQGLVPILSAGREKTLASAGHVPPYTLKSWV